MIAKADSPKVTLPVDKAANRKEEFSERPVHAEVREGMLWVTLEDGRIIAAPVEWYPILARATPQQQANVRLTVEGMRWDEIDEDISVPGMLRSWDGTTDALEAVMTVKEAADEFGISVQAVHDALKHDWLPARKSGGTYLIRRRDAEERWGGKKSPNRTS